MSRTAYNLGPGCVEYNSLKFYSKDDIIVTEALETENEISSVYGKIGERINDRHFEITFTPIGELESLTKYYPYQGSKIGDDIFPATDLPLIVWGLDGTKRTYNAAAMTKMPDLDLSTGKSLFGQVTFLCLGSGDTAWSGANSLVTHATAQTFPTTTLDTATLFRNAYTGVWGAKAAPWNALKTIDGFKVGFNLQLQDKSVDNYGVVQKCIAGLEVTLTFDPVGVLEADVLSAIGYQGAGAARGMNLSGLGANMVITGGTTPNLLTATIKGAAIKDYKLTYGFKTPRIKDVVMVAQNTVLGGTLGDYFTIGLS